MSQTIEPGYQAFTSDGGEEFGAIRDVTPKQLIVYVENAGEFRVSREAVHAVHSGKVIFDRSKLDEKLRRAIGHAHDAEEPGL
ncbi:MAG TPA: hypothetical protein VMR50_22260 [Myxococcota bacterium]|nr:hypothetical protein [Myxococcota bacterium]